MKLIFIGLLLSTTISLGAAPLKKPFSASLPQGECRIRASRSAAIDAYSERASSERMDTWESDLLVWLVTDIQQRLLPVCHGEERLAVIALMAKRAYVTKLSPELGKRSDEQIKVLYQGLSVQKSDVEQIRRNLPEKLGTPEEILKKIYSTDLIEVDGVLVLGPKESASRLRGLRQEICHAECPFWDTRYLSRVVIVTTKGLASYVPELGVLLLSNELFAKWSTLDQIVALHELAHVAERSALLARGKDWKTEFARLSGWQKAKGKWQVAAERQPASRTDRLSQDSQGSSFSILPDPVVEGFVLKKSLDASLRQNDPGEDLADHIAVARLFPERFCLDGKPFAASKLAWVKRVVFPELKLPSCFTP